MNTLRKWGIGARNSAIPRLRISFAKRTKCRLRYLSFQYLRTRARDVKGHSHHRQQELWLLVVARLVAMQNGRISISTSSTSRPTTRRPGPNCCCCRPRSWCRAWSTTASKSGTRWRSPSICTRLIPRPACCRPIRRSGPIAARSAARCIPGFSNLRSALPMNLKAHFPGFKSWAGAQADIDRVTTIWRDCLGQYGGPYLFGKTPCAADAMYAPVCSRFQTYDVALDPVSAQYRQRHHGAAADAGVDRSREGRARRTRRTRRRVLIQRQSHFMRPE